MSQSSSAIAHSPVNNFNPSQAEEFLAKAYEQSLREAQKPGASQRKFFFFLIFFYDSLIACKVYSLEFFSRIVFCSLSLHSSGVLVDNGEGDLVYLISCTNTV